MGRRKGGQPIHGWLIVDKPLGITSTQVVGRVRRLFDAQRVGHGGTLDPLASGVLPVALGEATKTVAYAMDGAKTYRFTLKWGEETTTDDAEGPVTLTSPKRPSRAEIEAGVKHFIGEIEQVPPAFSAVKIEGQRAYDLAREGEVVELKPRLVRIDDFALLEELPDDRASFSVACGKGAYMRALARDLGRHLGTRAHIVQLRRTSVGPFKEADAISLDKLEALGQNPALRELLLPVETALDDIPALALTETEARRLKCGQAVSLMARVNRDRIGDLVPGDLVRAMAGEKLVAVARFEAGEVHPVRVLNL